jgi:serine/threonine protein kinase
MSEYQRGRVLGRGAFGTVYEAIHVLTGEPRALKVYSKSAGVPKDEISLASKVTNPNVCRIYDCFVDADGNVCAAMELVRGGTLRELIERSGPMPVEKALPLILQILNGLDAIHQEAIVHRDLKPRNILVKVDEEENVQLKIGDFGHACPLGTRTDFAYSRYIGTAPYAAPEQGLNGAICDARSDIHAVAVIFLSLLNGEVYTEAPSQIPVPTDLPRSIENAIVTAGALNPTSGSPRSPSFAMR